MTTRNSLVFERLRDAQITLMQNNFAQNMAIFKQVLPPIYDFYQNYTPRDITIEMDDHGCLNALQDNAFIYAENPEMLAKQQVDFYQKHPRHFHFQPSTAEAVARTGPTFMHGHYLHRINEAGLALNKKTPKKCITLMPVLAVIGSGLGYHIRDLIEAYHVRHLLIYEPNPDLFYASLFTIDYTEIIKKCTSRYHSITIKIDGSATEFCNEVSILINKHGIFNCSHIFIYRHYRSEPADAAFNLLHELAHRLMQGWGFVEDELVSIAHTLHNFQSPTQLLLPKARSPQHTQNVPAFIIANGPSLDKDLDYLRTHASCGVLISVGTTIATLYHAGITPDFHVEIERGSHVANNFTALPEAYLKTITLLTINPIHADTCSRFQHVIFAFKHQDIGALCATSSLSEFANDPLTNSNPLAGNGAIAFALRFGFDKLVFFGLDMAAGTSGEHHAKNSLYYTSRVEIYSAFRAHYPLTRQGNRRKSVATNETLDYSRFVIEAALSKAPHVTAWNCSDGLTISHSTTVDTDSLDFLPNSDAKKTTLANIKNHYTQRVDECFEPILANFQHHFTLTKKCCNTLMDLLKPDICTVVDLLNVFAEQTRIIEAYQNHSMIAYQLLIGSLRYLQAATTSWVIHIPDGEPVATYIRQSLQVMRDYFRTVFALVEDHYLSLAGSYNPKDYLADVSW